MYRFLILYFRNVKNNPKLFFINISSFSIGIVAVLFITLFVVKEFNADHFHEKYNDIYRVLYNVENAPIKYSDTQYPLGRLLQNNHLEVQNYTRFRDLKGYEITIDEKQFVDQKISYVDRSFFSIFDFNLSVGDFNLLFEQPNTIIIDQATARRYFNSIDVLGKTLITKYKRKRKNL